MSELSGVCEKDHLVQFYSTKTSLLKNLKSFIGGGLLAGDPCLVIATPEHLSALEKRLMAHDIDLGPYRAAGKFICLDAKTTLANIMGNGLPDEQAFRTVVGGALEQLL